MFAYYCWLTCPLSESEWLQPCLLQISFQIIWSSPNANESHCSCCHFDTLQLCVDGYGKVHFLWVLLKINVSIDPFIFQCISTFNSICMFSLIVIYSLLVITFMLYTILIIVTSKCILCTQMSLSSKYLKGLDMSLCPDVHCTWRWWNDASIDVIIVKYNDSQ